MNKFVLATANIGKINEMRSILNELDISVITRDELGITIDIEETGTTFLENATLKAKAICIASGLPAIADDSGLIVESLDGRPGLYSSSYGGDTLSGKERCEFLLSEIKKMEHRAAKFVCTIICIFPSGDILSATGECHGKISWQIQGSGGFGYDPVFIPEGMNETIAELSQEEKNAISHRGVALREFVEKLKAYYAGNQK